MQVNQLATLVMINSFCVLYICVSAGLPIQSFPIPQYESTSFQVTLSFIKRLNFSPQHDPESRQQAGSAATLPHQWHGEPPSVMWALILILSLIE